MYYSTSRGTQNGNGSVKVDDLLDGDENEVLIAGNGISYRRIFSEVKVSKRLKNIT